MWTWLQNVFRWFGLSGGDDDFGQRLSDAYGLER
jgi:hypothetical protein